MIIGNNDAIAAEQVNTVALLSGSSEAGADSFDAVAGDDRIVIACLPAVYQDAAIGTVCNMVIGHRQTGGVDAVNSGNAISTRDGIAFDPPTACI